MTKDATKPLMRADRERLMAEFDYEIGKALKSCDEGRTVDAKTAFAAARAEFEKARSKRAA